MNGLLRTFIAIDIPRGKVREEILKFQRTISQIGFDLKLVEPENIHITLRFLGDIQKKIIEDLKTELNRIQFSPFEVTLEGIGVFPDYRRINVIWVGIKGGNIGLVDLYSKINHVLEATGIPLDRRGLSPHITVVRVRSGRNREILSKTVGELEGSTFGSFEVNSFHLMQSNLTPKGPIYQSLHKVIATLR
ncbi:RNA 2',3'-cyclic phosphodiesterase [Candidatus Bathyarchaeota archaeon]|nr:RNA 2',3'-cyclic phosphodiesterase [Candidatus Bathyarchaeota archaeon]